MWNASNADQCLGQFLGCFPKEHAKQNLPDLLMHAMNLNIDTMYLHVQWPASKLRVVELTERKEAGLTTSTFQNSRRKLQRLVLMMPNN